MQSLANDRWGERIAQCSMLLVSKHRDNVPLRPYAGSLRQPCPRLWTCQASPVDVAPDLPARATRSSTKLTGRSSARTAIVNRRPVSREADEDSP